MKKPLAKLSAAELAAYVASHLRTQGIDVVLSGGACVTIYSENKYVSYDLDFINIGLVRRGTVKQVLATIGFVEENRYFKHPDSRFLIEVLSGPVAIGEENVTDYAELKLSTGLLRLLSPTDCVKDRLAAFYHWNDLQSLEQAALVATRQRINMREIERWSKREGHTAKFAKFKTQLK